jgi:hypothetical protein
MAFFYTIKGDPPLTTTDYIDFLRRARGQSYQWPILPVAQEEIDTRELLGCTGVAEPEGTSVTTSSIEVRGTSKLSGSQLEGSDAVGREKGL